MAHLVVAVGGKVFIIHSKVVANVVANYIALRT